MSLSMPRRLALRITKQAECVAVAEIPTFLCPGFARSLQYANHPICQAEKGVRIQRRFIQSQSQRKVKPAFSTPVSISTRLPTQCAGCGALSQTVTKDEAGYYSLTRKSVKEYLGTTSRPIDIEEETIVKKALENVDATILETLGMEKPISLTPSREPPVCDRCHNLKHHEMGVSIHHPSIRALEQTIYESPYKYNHIYHIIDAADFPMSFIPALTRTLNLAPLRSQNRRSKTSRYYGGRKTELSFIITRSDLLAPLKTQVDSMMPYLTSVLRDILGRSGRDVRLGNVRCVSAVRGWWTTQLKDDIYSRGGGNWMVGKVNVGKSQLFQNVFPKGRAAKIITGKPLPVVATGEVNEHNVANVSSTTYTPITVETEEEDLDLQEDKDGIPDNISLLPPAQEETNYPSMPLVSPLPGTTASPIRIPFGNGKGELIDLPGLSRGDLELHVQQEHRSSLVMRSRIKPEQQVIKPGQSLLLGGFIRITPTSPDIVVLAYAFTPVDPHLTSTEKAIGIQTRTRESNVENISLPGTEEKVASAGVFPLKWDVTKARTGPITASSAVGLKVDQLPYKVLSTDILIEGCGWVEVVAQVSKRRSMRTTASENDRNWGEVEIEDDSSWPSVEVFTPDGKFIAARKPMNAWLNCVKKSAATKGRPRRSMKGAKKKEKNARRQSM